jgi:hypothetical protein
MTGSDFNFGPDWMWKLLAVLCVIGAATVFVAMCIGVAWLAMHIKFS